jgi:hypothetical protein
VTVVPRADVRLDERIADAVTHVRRFPG